MGPVLCVAGKINHGPRGWCSVRCGRGLRPPDARSQVFPEPNEFDMLTALFASLSAALGPWFPLLGLLLGVGGPLCIWLQGRSAAEVARINAGTQVAVAAIAARAQVEVARVTATGTAEVAKLPRKRRISESGTAAKMLN